MITKYEKKVTETIDGETVVRFEQCSESEAEYIHYCYNDENQPKKCKRVKL